MALAVWGRAKLRESTLLGRRCAIPSSRRESYRRARNAPRWHRILFGRNPSGANTLIRIESQIKTTSKEFYRNRRLMLDRIEQLAQE
jgi:hypothetical protein